MNVPGVAITVTPPARASEHSPRRSDCTARCNATSDDEHAVSTDNAGPSSPNTYATRPDTTLPSRPVSEKPASSPASAPSVAGPYSDRSTPANTPASLPRTDTGSMPASSTASHAHSSSSRCCGSIATASRGEIPKNPASKWPASYKNPPSCAYDTLAVSHPRSAGNPPTASTPPATTSHNPCADAAPPGNRQPTPTTATGSCWAASTSTSRCRA